VTMAVCSLSFGASLLARPRHKPRRLLRAVGVVASDGQRSLVQAPRAFRDAATIPRTCPRHEEPIDGTAWPEIPERSAFEVTPDLRLRIEPLDES
jgi:hypothetical protein